MRYNKANSNSKLRRLLPPLTRSPVSLRLGHARALTPHRGVIHYPRAASLPPGGRLISRRYATSRGSLICLRVFARDSARQASRFFHRVILSLPKSECNEDRMMRSIIRDLGGKSSTSLRSAQNDTGAPHAISTVGEDTILPKTEKMQKVRRTNNVRPYG